MQPTATIRKLLREHLPPGPALAADPEGSTTMFEAIGRRLEPLAGVVDVTQRRLWRDDARPIVVYEIQEPGDETYHWRSLSLEFSINEQHELVLRTAGQTVPIADLGGLVTFVRACQAALQRRRAQTNKRQKLCHLKTQAIIARIKAIAKEDGFDFATRTDTVKVKLYVKLSARDVIEIQIPFKKFEQILPGLRTSIAAIRQLHADGIRFSIKQSSPRLDWTDHKTL